MALLGILPMGAEALSRWSVLLIGAPAGAAIASLLIWPYRKDALGGAAIAFFAHPLMWYLAMLILWASGAKSSLNELTVNPIEALTACWIFSAWSWFLTGWLTVPAGGLLGWWLARRE